MVGDVQGTQKGPKRARESYKHQFLNHSAPKNALIQSKFEIELPILCNFLHVKFHGLGCTASWGIMAEKQNSPQKILFFDLFREKRCF